MHAALRWPAGSIEAVTAVTMHWASVHSHKQHSAAYQAIPEKNE